MELLKDNPRKLFFKFLVPAISSAIAVAAIVYARQWHLVAVTIAEALTAVVAIFCMVNSYRLQSLKS